MTAFLNNVGFLPTLGGTTDWTFSAALTGSGYQSLSAASAVNGKTYGYFAKSADLTQWELGSGAYNSGTGVLARTTVVASSTGSKVSFTNPPQVFIVALAGDLPSLSEDNSFQGIVRSNAELAVWNATPVVRLADGSGNNLATVTSVATDVYVSNAVSGGSFFVSLFGFVAHRFLAGSLRIFGTTSGYKALAVAAAADSGTLTLPPGTDTLVAKATTDTLTNKTFDTAGTGNSLKVNGTSITAVAGSGVMVLSGALRGYISGLTLSAAGSTATFGIAAGIATDGAFTDLMLLSSAYTKTTSAWAVGSASGAMDTGSVANSTWYHVHLIKRPDAGVVDVLFSLSAISPTLPTNYTLFRRIGSMKTNGSAQWVKFIQDGDLFRWDVPVADFNVANPGTAAVSRTLTVPTGINAIAHIRGRSSTVTATTATATLYSDLAVADTTPDFVGNAQAIANTSLGPVVAMQVRCNTSAQIRVRSSFSDANVNVYCVTEGWNDTRGQ